MTEDLIIRKPGEKLYRVLESWDEDMFTGGFLLGTGSFSKVYLFQEPRVVCKSREHYCLGKDGYYRYGVTEEDVEDCRREVEILETCQSKFVVRMYDAYVVLDRSIKIIMEGGKKLDTLFKYWRLQGEELSAVLYCLVSAVAHIHDLGIVHGDIKPDNLIWSMVDGCIKLCDFGASWRIGKDDKSKVLALGTTSYAAPEILPSFLDSDVVVPFGKEQDIWAIGLIAFRMYYGNIKLPKRFHFLKKAEKANCSTSIIMKLLRKRRIEFAKEDNVEAELVKFVEDCTEINPVNRPAASSLLNYQVVNGSPDKYFALLGELIIKLKDFQVDLGNITVYRKNKGVKEEYAKWEEEMEKEPDDEVTYFDELQEVRVRCFDVIKKVMRLFT